jgi:hypothetical protein
MELKRGQKNMSATSEEREREGLVGLGITNEEIEVWYELAEVSGRMLLLPELHPIPY